MINLERITKEYPTALNRVCEYFRNRPDIVEAMDEIKLDSKDRDNFVKALVGNYIKRDPRKLYDAFDSLNVYISVTYSESQDAFVHYVNHSDSTASDSRVKCEEVAIVDAFQLLEKQ